jgi:hypothetical protein
MATWACQNRTASSQVCGSWWRDLANVAHRASSFLQLVNKNGALLRNQVWFLVADGSRVLSVDPPISENAGQLTIPARASVMTIPGSKRTHCG